MIVSTIYVGQVALAEALQRSAAPTAFEYSASTRAPAWTRLLQMFWNRRRYR